MHVYSQFCSTHLALRGEFATANKEFFLVALKNQKRIFTVKFRCTANEKTKIIKNAAAARMQIAPFVRTSALLEPVKIPIDYDALKELVSLHGDLGRAAGLLKVLMIKKINYNTAKVNEVVADFRKIQDELRDKITSL